MVIAVELRRIDTILRKIHCPVNETYFCNFIVFRSFQHCIDSIGNGSFLSVARRIHDAQILDIHTRRTTAVNIHSIETSGIAHDRCSLRVSASARLARTAVNQPPNHFRTVLGISQHRTRIEGIAGINPTTGFVNNLTALKDNYVTATHFLDIWRSQIVIAQTRFKIYGQHLAVLQVQDISFTASRSRQNCFVGKNRHISTGNGFANDFYLEEPVDAPLFAFHQTDTALNATGRFRIAAGLVVIQHQFVVKAVIIDMAKRNYAVVGSCHRPLLINMVAPHVFAVVHHEVAIFCSLVTVIHGYLSVNIAGHIRITDIGVPSDVEIAVDTGKIIVAGSGFPLCHIRNTLNGQQRVIAQLHFVFHIVVPFHVHCQKMNTHVGGCRLRFQIKTRVHRARSDLLMAERIDGKDFIFYRPFSSGIHAKRQQHECSDYCFI